MMWREVNPDGTLAYTFVESVKATYPFYVVRLVGGLMYLAGMLIMAWNTVMTARQRPQPVLATTLPASVPVTAPAVATV